MSFHLNLFKRPKLPKKKTNDTSLVFGPQVPKNQPNPFLAAPIGPATPVPFTPKPIGPVLPKTKISPLPKPLATIDSETETERINREQREGLARVEPPKLDGEDFSKAFKSIAGVDDEVEKGRADLEASRQTEQEAFDAKRTGIEQLLTESQKMHQELFQGEDITRFREQSQEAFAAFQNIDVQEQQALEALRARGRERGGGLGTSFIKEAGIISNTFNSQRAGASARFAIAQNNLNSALQFADRAFDFNLNVMEARIGLLDDALSRSTTLSERERADFTDVLNRAQAEMSRRQEEKSERLNTFLELSQAGVTGLDPSDDIESMLRRSGPALASFATKKRELEELKQQLSIAKDQATINKLRADIAKNVEDQVIDFGDEKRQRILSSVDDLLGRVSGFKTTGIAGLTKFLPLVPAKDFDNDLNTLKANLAFGELQAMRDASKTGGALGQVSEKELTLLESALAGLAQTQSPANMRKNLNKIKDSINRWYDAAGLSADGGGGDIDISDLDLSI